MQGRTAPPKGTALQAARRSRRLSLPGNMEPSLGIEPRSARYQRAARPLSYDGGGWAGSRSPCAETHARLSRPSRHACPVAAPMIGGRRVVLIPKPSWAHPVFEAGPARLSGSPSILAEQRAVPTPMRVAAHQPFSRRRRAPARFTVRSGGWSSSRSPRRRRRHRVSNARPQPHGLAILEWCPARELNPHASRRQALDLVRLPFRQPDRLVSAGRLELPKPRGLNAQGVPFPTRPRAR